MGTPLPAPPPSLYLLPPTINPHLNTTSNPPPPPPRCNNKCTCSNNTAICSHSNQTASPNTPSLTSSSNKPLTTLNTTQPLPPTILNNSSWRSKPLRKHGGHPPQRHGILQPPAPGSTTSSMPLQSTPTSRHSLP